LVIGLISLSIGALAPTASAAIAEGNVSTAVNAESGATSIVVPAPANIAAGDLLIAQVTFEKGIDVQTITQTPAWTLIARRNRSSDIGQAIYRRVATASEPADYTWGFLKDNKPFTVRATGGIARYTGVNMLHPDGPVVATSGNDGDGTALTATGITAPANSMLIAFFGITRKTTLTTPSNMSDGYFKQHDNQSGTTIRASKQLWTSGGATLNRVSNTASGQGNKWIAQLIALRPNTVPVYTAPAAQTANEGTAKSFPLGSFVDPDAHGTWEITVDWGDDSDPETFSFASGQATPFAARALGNRSHTYDDSGNYTVAVTIDDGIDEVTGNFAVEVANLAPTATFDNDGPVDEGGSVTVEFSDEADASPVDTAAGFRYAFDCGGVVANLPTTYAAAGLLSSTTCPFDDDGTFTVAGRIFDKDNGHSTYDTSFSVNNVPPTADLGNDGPILEGGSATIAFTGASDPSQADTNAGFRYAFACDGDTASLPTTYESAGTATSASCSFDDDGNYTVAGRVFDKDDGYNTYPTVVTVANVPPTATLSNDGPILEGGSATIAFTGASDPSQPDTDAGFRYAFACDGDTGSLPTTYESAGTATSASCSFDDSGDNTAAGRVFDKDDGHTTYTTVVTVANVAPTGVLGDSGPVFEGSSVTVGFSSEHDPSSVDLASLRFAYDCAGNTAALPASYEGAGTDDATCSFADDGNYTVAGRIYDKDDGFTTYTHVVTVDNALPFVTSYGDQEATAGQSAEFDLGSFGDAGVNDGPWTVNVNWGDASTNSTFLAPSQGSLGLLAHTYAAAGSYTVTVRVTDKDVGYGETTFVVTVTSAVVIPPAEIRFEAACTGMTNAPKGDASKYLTICTPDGVQAGDVLLAQIGFEKGSDAGTDAQITPLGWTLVRRTNSKTDIGQAIFVRVATGSEQTSYTWPFKQAVKAAGGILRYSGVDTANPIVASTGNSGDSNTLTGLSVNAEEDSMLIAAYVFKKKDTTLVVPAHMTERYNYQNPQDVTIRIAEELRDTAGLTGNRVATPSPKNSDKWVAQLVTLRAAP
jgi:hypothetical protein